LAKRQKNNHKLDKLKKTIEKMLEKNGEEEERCGGNKEQERQGGKKKEERK
jgi:hypothetical protein